MYPIQLVGGPYHGEVRRIHITSRYFILPPLEPRVIPMLWETSLIPEPPRATEYMDTGYTAMVSGEMRKVFVYRG